MEDYNIRVGDYVETVDGDVGYVYRVYNVQNNDFAYDRFNVRLVKGPHAGDDFMYPVLYSAMCKKFKYVGRYEFAKDKPKDSKKIEPLNSLTMSLIGNDCYVEIKNKNGTRGYINLVQFRDKINEIIAYINSKEA